MPGESSPEEMKEIGGGHLHHKEQPVMPELLGEEPGTRFKTEWARGSAKRALGGKSAKKEVLEEEIETLSSQPLKELLRSYIRLPEQVLQTEEGRRELLEKERFIREELIGKGQLEGRDLEVADKLIAAIGRKVEKIPEVAKKRPAAYPREEIPSTREEELLSKIAETLGVGVGELSGKELEEFKSDPEQWLRERVERLEALDWDFDSPQNRPILQEIVAAFPFIRKERPELEKEFFARYALHTYNNALISGPDIGTAMAKAGIIDRETLQILFRLKPIHNELPVVAEGFRLYEKHGHEIIAAVEEDALNRWRRRITLTLAREAGDPRLKGEVKEFIKATSEEKISEIEQDWAWAQRIAEKLWVVTGRSSYFDAFNKDPGKRLRGWGINMLRRIYNLRKWIQEQKAGAEFWRDEARGNKFLDLKIRDFWSELPAKKKDDKKKDDFAIKYGLKESSDENEDQWITSLENIKFEEMDFANELPPVPPLLSYMDKANKADKARPLLGDPGGFLDQPTWEKFRALLGVFGHRRGNKKKEILKDYLDALIVFNKQRSPMPGRRSYSEEEYKWKPWDSVKIYTVIESLLSEGFITGEQARALERKHGATRLGVEARLAVRSGVVGGGKEFLRALLESLGIKI